MPVSRIRWPAVWWAIECIDTPSYQRIATGGLFRRNPRCGLSSGTVGPRSCDTLQSAELSVVISDDNAARCTGSIETSKRVVQLPGLHCEQKFLYIVGIGLANGFLCDRLKFSFPANGIFSSAATL